MFHGTTLTDGTVAVVTPTRFALSANVHAWMQEGQLWEGDEYAPARADFCAEAVLRMCRGDWGDVCQEDADANDLSLRSGARLMGVYPLNEADLADARGDTVVWIFVEAGHDICTIIFPSEY